MMVFEQGWVEFEFGKNFLKHESPTLNCVGKMLIWGQFRGIMELLPTIIWDIF